MISNFIIFLLLFNCLNCSIEKSDLAIGFIILSQPNEYHKSLAEQLKVNILNQAKELHCEHKIKIYKSHEDFGNVLGHWTIQPLFKKLSKLENLDWMFFLEDQTHISVKEIFKIMLSYNSSQNIFVGYALKDSDPTIIHHFAATDENSVISYPHFSAGFFMSFSLISKLIMECKDCQFSIDPKYELAKFIWDNSATKLIHEPQLCLKKNLDICATWITENIPNCGHAIPAKKIFVAVKTCTKFHKDRVKVLKSTWAPDVENLMMFSDSEDPSIPTIQLNVENVATGHCQKTLSIMKFFDTGLLILSFDWLVIVDDDTLLSFHRLTKLLACYDPSKEVVIGERYGYSVSENFGYNYPTGGSGMIFSRKAIEKLVAFCHCPSNNSPDDMIIGVCLKNLDIDVTNSPFLHQARPNDYSPEFLASLKHISFHKHWMIDPYAVYTEWLQDSHVTSQHSEL